jgi:myo-inositol-1(or 4)-monophosphatase
VTERRQDLERIAGALERARAVLEPIRSRALRVDRKAGGDPVTEADRAVDAALRAVLVRPGEGWLSEETADDPARLGAVRVWIVDPLDGTREFVAGIPEWCVSVGLVEDGKPVAGGILNPVTGELVLGAAGIGVQANGAPVAPARREELSGAVVLASRSETNRGEWRRFAGAPFIVRPVGSVAYKLALVAVGLADATWTLVPKHEWDVAAGVALVLAAGGEVALPDGTAPSFNRRDPLLPGLVATRPGLMPAVRSFLGAADASRTSGGRTDR